MSSPIYEAIGFLQDDTDFDLAEAQNHLMKRLPRMKVKRRGNTVTVEAPGWSLEVHLADEPFVAEESRDMAAHFSACPRSAEIALSKRRVEIVSTDADPDMEHFNDFVFVCETLEKFRGLILFDPRSGDLM